MDAKQIIEKLGGTFAVANICEVTPGAVSQWKKRGIPNGHLKFLQTKYSKVFSEFGQKA